MTDQTVPDQPGVFTEVAQGLADGLPAFQRVEFGFASAADLRQWASRFGIKIPAMEGQPYPNLADPAASDEWIIRSYQTWNGLKVILNSEDPITDEQRQHWIDSGKAARHAEREAKAAGLDFSRTDGLADNPTPVSPARVPLHTGAVVDGGELVDEASVEVSTLSAAIRFSEARREAARAIGRTTPERLQDATLDLLHGQALDEDAARTRRADLRDGEQGRITNPNLAHFLAIKEERRRIAQHFLGLEESAKHYPAKPVSEAR